MRLRPCLHHQAEIILFCYKDMKELFFSTYKVQASPYLSALFVFNAGIKLHHSNCQPS
jgi:hypothetical protein